MLKSILLIVLLTILSGCAMTGDEMSSAIKECTDNNLSYRVYYNGLNSRINDIQCMPYDIEVHRYKEH